MSRYLLILLFFLYSCAGAVSISPKKCVANDGQWLINETNYQTDFSFKKSIYPFQDKKFYLKEILKDAGIKCRNIHQVKVTVSQNWKDILISAVPFINRHTLVVEGTLYEDEGEKKN